MNGSVDVEFSLALNNRTGKYFVCRDMIQSLGDHVRKIRYWRTSFSAVPGGLRARVLGRLMTIEFQARSCSPWAHRYLPAIRRNHPIIFTDPLQVVFYEPRAEDCVICHDMGPLTHPHFYAPGVQEAYQLAFRLICKAKLRLAFISQDARNAYEQLHGPAYRSAEVVYPAIRQETMSGATEPLPGLEAPFFLTVGAVGTRKNQLGVINAFKDGQFASRGFSLVVAGGPEPGFGQVAQAAQNTTGVIMPGYVTDSQLRWLYAHASAFVLPSLLEGFGFPAAEAALRGLVPVISRGGALEEIAGPGAILVDPHSADSILCGMEAVIALSDAERAARMQQLREHIGRFSSERAAEEWRSAFLSPPSRAALEPPRSYRGNLHISQRASGLTSGT